MTDLNLDPFATQHGARAQVVSTATATLAVVGAGLAAALTALHANGMLPVEATALAMTTYLAAAALVLATIRRASGLVHFGACNRVTTLRLGMVALLAGGLAAPDVVAPGAALAWAALALALAALALDGIDGWLARRWNQSSDFGARFDMEVDAAAIMVLAALAWQTGQAPVWVLALGLMRYAFVLAGWRLDFLQAALPPSFRRKAVCVVQVAVLAALLAPVIVPPLSVALAAGALVALTWSFAVDIRWLWRERAG